MRKQPLSMIALCVGGAMASVAVALEVSAGAVVPAALSLVCAALCVFAAIRVAKDRREAELELRSSRERTRLLEDSGLADQAASRALSVELGDSVARTVSIVHRLEGLASGAADGILVLNQSLSQAVEAHETTLGAYGRVKDALGSYSGEVATESTAVEAMVGSVDRLASSSREKGESVRALLERADGAESKLLSIKTAVDRMVESSRKTGDMNALIADLSERTNLLAINASIEAAHAGAAGKGFAIIAKQVKSLSEESRKNSQTISSAIALTMSSIGDTAGAAEGAIDYFRTVVSEIKVLAQTFEAFLSEMQALSDDSSSLLRSIALIAGLNDDTGAALRTSEDSMGKAKDSLGIVRDIALTIQSDAAAMMTAFKDSLAEAARAKELGERTTRTIGMGSGLR